MSGLPWREQKADNYPEHLRLVHTTYALWLNSAKFGNFKDAEGRAAVPYLLVFKTKK